MEDDIYEAEVATPNRDAKLLNGLAAMTIAFSIGFLMMSVLFSDSVTTLAKVGEERMMSAFVLKYGSEVVSTTLQTKQMDMF